MTFRSILVPLDGSQFGEHALPHALSLARRAGARLELVHVHVPGSLYDLPDSHVAVPEDEDRHATELARAYLDGVARRVKAASGGEVAATILRGHVGDSLCDHVANSRPDLVVLTTHGRGPLSRFWLGSVTTDLIQRAAAPLLLVRPAEGSPDLSSDPAPRRILVPLDGSRFAEHVLPMAVAVGELCGSEYRLLRVVPPVRMGGWDGTRKPPEGVRTVAEQLEADARRYLNGLAAHAPGLGAARVHVAVTWPPAGAILDDAAAGDIDLIAMETRGHGGIARLLLGSVADKVVRGATVPVLLRRPAAAE